MMTSAQSYGFGEGQAVTPEIQAKLDLMRIQQENASLVARAKIRQDVMIGLGILVAGVSISIGVYSYSKG